MRRTSPVDVLLRSTRINPGERPIKPFDFVDLDDGKIVGTCGRAT